MRFGLKKNLATGLVMVVSFGYLGLHLKDHQNEKISNLIPYSESLHYQVINGKVIGSSFRNTNGVIFLTQWFRLHCSAMKI